MLTRSILLCIALISNTCASAALNDGQVAELKAELAKQANTYLRARKSAGFAMVVLDEGTPIMLVSAGFANKSSGAMLQPDTPLPLADVSNILIALTAERLAQKSQLNLQHDVRTLLPKTRFDSNFPPQPISLHSLLVGFSGIGQGEAFGLYRAAQVSDSTQIPNVIWLVRPPGQLSQDGALAQQLLARAVESSTDRRYVDLLQSEVIAPLKLTRTSIGAPGNIGIAIGHDKKGIVSAPFARYQASNGAYASLNDLSKILAALDQDAPAEFLSASARAKFMSPQNIAVFDDFPDLQSGPAYGFDVNQSTRTQVGTVLSAYGFGIGSQVRLNIFPRHRLAFAAFSNSSELSEAFSDAVEDVIDLALQRKSGAPKREKKLPVPISVNLPAGVNTDTPAPLYATAAGMLRPAVNQESFDFKLAGFGLNAKRREDGWYQLRYRLLGMIPLSLSFIENVLIRPVKRANGERLMLYSAGNSVGVLGNAYTPAAIDANTRRYLGEYSISNPDRTIEAAKFFDIALAEESGALVLKASIDAFINVNLSMPIQVHSNTRWSFAGHAPGLGELITPSADASSIMIAGYQLVKAR
jgi:CubicO group peptidase (beta-lactamase class C family)